MTSKELAKMLGVHQSTISRALNDSPLVAEKTKKYIKEKAEEQGFVLNSQAQSLKTNKTRIIGILFPVFFESLSKNLMFTYIYDVIQKELIQKDYDIMVIYDYGVASGINVLERIVKSQKVDGFVNLRPFLSDKEIELIEQYQVPFVTMFNAEQNSNKLHEFMVDEFSAGFQVGAYLGMQTEWEYVYVSLPIDQKNSHARLEGYKRGLESVGKQLTKIITCELSTKDAYRAVTGEKDWFKTHKAASYVYNDMLALGVVQALKTMGIDIPGQAQIIGMDDIPITTWLPPHISTMRAPINAIVRDGCLLLCRLIDGETVPPKTRIYQSSLVHRDTTKG